MRFKITLHQQGKAQIIPINYQYELSSWIYRVIETADSEFSHFLHSQGYQKGSKQFKLFTFSRFYHFKFKRIQDRLKLLSDSLSFDIAFHIDKAAEKFVMGLFQEQQLTLGDQITQAHLAVEQVSVIPVTVSTTTITLQAHSPIVIAQPRLDPDGKLRKDYIPPTHPDYEGLFLRNLQEKYISYLLEKNEGTIELSSEVPLQFKLLSEQPKSVLVKIKANTAKENKVKGYFYHFELTAPIPLIELGLNAGFGVQNSLGFGCCGEPTKY